MRLVGLSAEELYLGCPSLLPPLSPPSPSPLHRHPHTPRIRSRSLPGINLTSPSTYKTPDRTQRRTAETLVGRCAPALRKQLQELQTKLSAEKEESKNSKRRADFLEGELMQVRGQLDSVAETLDQIQRRSSKQEMKLLEAHEMIADKEGIIEEKEHNILLVKKEIEDLVKENENLKGDIDELRRVYADYQAAPSSSSVDPPAYVQPDDVQPAASSIQDGSEQSENLYETIGSEEPEEEQALVCRHCQERFPGITQQELEQHEQSHRVCPFCTMICDNMEQSVFEDHVYSHEL
ncbi:calcium-binding and coiled-coil domain-containing protein 2-like [Scomber japonicus]|uniref:calcium-binding and coiled-coil domain-containing protein 2-like n=1 Tax=Scomber japonicus TaxID=13676 RepID=UPI002305CCDA|nr:calcium-binding and coiled-coil domain-containing protein 2-like [Scomber japonicus]